MVSAVVMASISGLLEIGYLLVWIFHDWWRSVRPALRTVEGAMKVAMAGGSWWEEGGWLFLGVFVVERELGRGAARCGGAADGGAASRQRVQTAQSNRICFLGSV